MTRTFGNPERKAADAPAFNFMEAEERDFWLDILEANLLDERYTVADDDEVHFKISALGRMRFRLNELETMLMELDEFRDGLGKIIGPRL